MPCVSAATRRAHQLRKQPCGEHHFHALSARPQSCSTCASEGEQSSMRLIEYATSSLVLQQVVCLVLIEHQLRDVSRAIMCKGLVGLGSSMWIVLNILNINMSTGSQ